MRAYNENMKNENQNKNQGPLTLDQLVKYNQEVLLPAFDLKIENLRGDLVAKKEFSIFKEEFNEFKDKMYTDIDYLINKVDRLVKENKIRNYQENKQKEFFAIMIKAMKEHNILSSEELQKISQLNIL